MIFGRTPTARNLATALHKGTWAVVFGGPGMGKTTLLGQAQDARAAEMGSIRIDLRAVSARGLRLDPAAGPPPLLLIDHCEALLPHPQGFIHQVAAWHGLGGHGPSAPGVSWGGNSAWGEWAMAHRGDFGQPVRDYPLVVLSPREVRRDLARALPPGTPAQEMERLLGLSGGHPYLLSALIQRREPDFADFFAALWAEVKTVSERAVLNRLVSAGAWVPLAALKDERGEKPAKSLLDRLATSGLIIRTLVDGEAAARIVSPLFANWIRATHP